MAQPSFTTKTEPVPDSIDNKPGSTATVESTIAGAQALEFKGATVSISVAPNAAPSENNGAVTLPVIKDYLKERLVDAELLIEYAAESGIEVDENTRKSVLKARFHSDVGVTEQGATDLLAALTRLAAKLRPVTASSLKARTNASVPETRFYIWMASILIALIIPYSIAAFVTGGLSDKIRQDVTTANALAVKLSDLLGPADTNYHGPRGLVKQLPADVPVKDVITDLQLFASTIRTIDGQAKLLNAFVFSTGTDRLAGYRRDPNAMRLWLELPRGLPDIPDAANDRIQVYQDIRYFALDSQQRASLFYGAFANHILPMLYALLGSCAYLARRLEAQIRDKTFTGANRHLVHFLVAGIGGLIVGLFTSFTAGQTATLSPLAIAFLAGYAVDVFFTFLENIIQVFNKGKAQTTAEAKP